jgi:hypothetical protein
MKIGVLVTTDKHLDHLTGIIKEALKRGHELTVFFMDEGSSLLERPEFKSLSEEYDFNASYCDLNARSAGVDCEAISGYVSSGSQYDNALMMSTMDRVISL